MSREGKLYDKIAELGREVKQLKGHIRDLMESMDYDEDNITSQKNKEIVQNMREYQKNMLPSGIKYDLKKMLGDKESL